MQLHTNKNIKIIVTQMHTLKVAEFPKLALKHGILLNLPI